MNKEDVSKDNIKFINFNYNNCICEMNMIKCRIYFYSQIVNMIDLNPCKKK